jgi:UPF0755 protein
LRKLDVPVEGRRVRPPAGKPGFLHGRFGVVVALAVLFLTLSAASCVLSCPLPKGSAGVSVYVEPGSSTVEVADLLYRSGVVRSPLAFRALARLMGADGKIQSGEYLFEPGIYAWDAISSLVQGRVVYYSLTVREGLTAEKIASLIEERGFGDREKFLALAKDPSLAPDLVSREELEGTRYVLEGYLFPDTYYIRRGMSEREIVAMMLKRFSQVFSRDLQDKARGAGMTPHQVATLASIVEREAFAAEERPVIAAVYLNRLKIGMKLDADPTVVYALGEVAGYSLLYKDLEVDSPYNTYRNAGLPPGPIGNFGKASLEAVLNPRNVDYLYFVAKKDGSHAFARTLSEHNVNVARYRDD